MTTEEAINRYKTIYIDNSCWVKSFCDGDCGKCCEMDEIILDALRTKEEKDVISHGIEGQDETWFECPNCGGYLTGYYIEPSMHHCRDCGQRLKWRTETDGIGDVQ